MENKTIIDRQFKMVIRSDHDAQLFDILQDPWEDHDIAAQHMDVVDRMQAWLENEEEEDHRC